MARLVLPLAPSNKSLAADSRLDRETWTSLTLERTHEETRMQTIWQFLVSGFTVLLVSAAAHDTAAQTNTPPSKVETRLITLGTVAGPPPRPHRAQFSNLLIVNDTLYVVDAGDGVARRIAKAGFNVRDVGTIFITHHHDDHTKIWSRLRCNISRSAPRSELPTEAVQYRLSNYSSVTTSIPE